MPVSATELRCETATRQETVVSVDFDGPIPLFVAGRWEAGERPLEVYRPYDGSPVGATWLASADQVERAVAAAHAVRARGRGAAAARARRGAGHDRRRIAERAEEIGRADHRRERQADHLGRGRGGPGRVGVPLGRRGDPPRSRRGAAARHGRRRPRAGWRYVRRVPKGPVLAITPVQLPAQPGGAQGGPGDRGRRADRGEAGAQDPAVGAAARRDRSAETGPARRAWST